MTHELREFSDMQIYSYSRVTRMGGTPMPRGSVAWQKIFTSVSAILLMVLSACNQSSTPAQTKVSGPPPYSGVIRGRVVFDGTAPEPKTSPGTTVQDESLQVGPQSGLENVLVFLKNPPKTNCVSPTPVMLDQIKMKFVPHVLGVQTGQTLRLKSSDVMPHNVHLKCSINPDQNHGFSGPGIMDISLDKPEPPFCVKCDVHPWMTAWIGVFAHPWFAVSGADGSFLIEHVPPGKYTLSTWHEVLLPQEAEITVSDSAPAEVTIHFRTP
jgi:plastocyanin